MVFPRRFPHRLKPKNHKLGRNPQSRPFRTYRRNETAWGRWMIELVRRNTMLQSSQGTIAFPRFSTIATRDDNQTRRHTSLHVTPSYRTPRRAELSRRTTHSLRSTTSSDHARSSASRNRMTPRSRSRLRHGPPASLSCSRKRLAGGQSRIDLRRRCECSRGRRGAVPRRSCLC
jgi:hypothetical protein